MKIFFLFVMSIWLVEWFIFVFGFTYIIVTKIIESKNIEIEDVQEYESLEFLTFDEIHTNPYYQWEQNQYLFKDWF